MKRSRPKTTRVQITRPPFTTSGPLVAGSSCWARARIRVSIKTPVFLGSHQTPVARCAALTSDVWRLTTSSKRNLPLHQQRDNRNEQSDAFDQRGEDQAAGLNSGTVLGLARHTIRHRAADPADSNSGTDDRQAGAQSGTDQSVASAGAFRRSLN